MRMGWTGTTNGRPAIPERCRRPRGKPPHRENRRRGARAAMKRTGDVMRKRMLTTRGVPVVALGLAAALAFAGGPRLTVADQSDTTGRTVSASSLTSGQLGSPTNVGVESSGTTGGRQLSPVSLTGTDFGGPAVEAGTSQGGRSLSARSLTGASFGGPAVEAGENSGGRALSGKSLTSGTLTNVAIESTTQSGGRSLSPATLTGGSL